MLDEELLCLTLEIIVPCYAILNTTEVYKYCFDVCLDELQLQSVNTMYFVEYK